MEGRSPEPARGMAMTGAKILYRPAYPEPYVSNGLWEIQNRARALDNTCYVVAPNPANYFLTEESSDALRYLRRKVHDRGLPGQNSLRARIRSWAFVRRGHP